MNEEEIAWFAEFWPEALPDDPAGSHVSPASAAAGLPYDLTFHGLRHVVTSFIVEAGEHPRVIQHRLGHATARLSMELYAHVPEAADRTAAQHLDAAFCAGSGTGVARQAGA
jgi:site-specific recombinase XerD